MIDKIKQEQIQYFNIDHLTINFDKTEYWSLRENRPEKIVLPFDSGSFYIDYKCRENNNKKANYDLFLYLKYEYKGKKYNLISIGFWKFNKLFLHWKLFRLSKLRDTDFDINDILDFIFDKFTNISIHKLELCLDIKSHNNSLLEEIAKKLKKEDNNSYTYYDNSAWFESVNMWKLDEKDNKEYYYRIYDKKKEIIVNKSKNFYLNYFDFEESVYRFEISIRSRISKKINFKNLYFNWWKNKKLFNILLTYFQKKNVDIFDNIEYERTLIKAIENEVKWSNITKIKKLDLEKMVKATNTNLKNIEYQSWIHRYELMGNIDKTVKDLNNYDEYIFLYRSLFSTINEVYKNNENYLTFQELKQVIEWWLEYIADTFDITWEEFIYKIKWAVNSNLELFLDNFTNNMIKIIYIYYEESNLQNEKILSFLNIINEDNVNEFRKYFDKKISKKYISRIKKKVEYVFNDKEIDNSNFIWVIFRNNEK